LLDLPTWWGLRPPRKNLADEVFNLKPECLFARMNCPYQQAMTVSFHILCNYNPISTNRLKYSTDRQLDTEGKSLVL
jgi:hypothetical protein